jgi:hypothetical protein
VLALLAATALLGAGLPRTCFEAPRALSAPGAFADLSFNFKKSVATLPDGSVHATWFGLEDGLHRVYYTRSADGGDHWEPARALSDPGAEASHPAIAAAAGRVYVAWHEWRAGGQEVFLRMSPDAGASFGAASALSRSGGATHVSLAASGARVYAVWGDLRSGAAEIYARASANGGVDFAPETRLSDEPFASWVPSVAAWGDAAVVAWVDYRDANEEEYVRVSRDGGHSWEAAVRVTSDPADSWAPSVALRGDAIFLAWFDRRPAGLLDADVEAVLDAALALLGQPVTPPPPRDPAVYYLPGFHARIAAKREAIQAAAPAWVAAGGDRERLDALLAEFERRMESWSRGWGVFLARSPDLGASWEPARLISTPGGPAQRPSLDVALPDLHVAWFDGRHGANEVYYRRSPDAGERFLPEQRVTVGDGEALRPSLAAAKDGHNVHLVWARAREDDQALVSARGRVVPAASPSAASAEP